LSDPSDQDVVRSRLCRTQWPSRKVGRIGLACGSMAKARFFKLSQYLACICDVAHRRPVFGRRRACRGERSRKIGIIIQKYFPSYSYSGYPLPTLPMLGPQNSICMPVRLRAGFGPSHHTTRVQLISIAKQGQCRPRMARFGCERYQT
jgi:hypothetical protein